MSYGTDQKLFMQLAGQTVDCPDDEQAERYFSHLIEEFRETVEAHDAGDEVKTLDGMGDMVVVILGYLISKGYDPDEVWNPINEANMTKVDGSLGPIVRRADNQVGKPEGFVGPEGKLKLLVDGLMARFPDHFAQKNSNAS